ncbi:MAG: DUF1413 domain-containing protein [Ruminococcus sp.]|nr:DUF1413 domain-containing protein [Ruminococcus sp.]
MLKVKFKVSPERAVQMALDLYSSGSVICVSDIFPSIWNKLDLPKRMNYGKEFESYVKSMNSNSITRNGAKNGVAAYLIG